MESWLAALRAQKVVEPRGSMRFERALFVLILPLLVQQIGILLFSSRNKVRVTFALIIKAMSVQSGNKHEIYADPTFVVGGVGGGRHCHSLVDLIIELYTWRLFA